MRLQQKIHRTFFPLAWLMLLTGLLGALLLIASPQLLLPSPSHDLLDPDPPPSLHLATAALSSILVLAALWIFHRTRRLSRHITQSMADANHMAEAVASGDLAHTLPVQGDEEFAALASTLNRLVENLHLADQEITREIEDRTAAETRAKQAVKTQNAFLAHMSHEFRTPLNGILGYTQRLLLDSGLSDKNHQMVFSLRRAGEHLLELVNDVLDLAKIEAGSMKINPTRFYLADMLESIRRAYEDLAHQHGLSFDLILHPDLPDDLHGDPARLRQVLVNLTGNAIKFTPSGGIQIRVSPSDNHIRFEVADTGPGVPPEDQERIFKPFEQADSPGQNARRGTGLGLPISNHLLKNMGSELHLQSTPGEGAVFSFTLPQPEHKTRRLIHSPPTLSGHQPPQRRVLLADPAGQTASLIVPLLKETGFLVEQVSRTRDLLDLLPDFLPHVLLVDHQLHDAQGLDVPTAILNDISYQQNAHIPLFYLTDLSLPNEQEKALALGVTAVLPKPLGFTQLTELFEEHLDVVWITDPNNTPHSQTTSLPQFQPGDPAPDHNQLSHLLERAQAGDVRGVRESLESLQTQHPQWRPFCHSLLDLCQKYRMNDVVSLLQSTLASSHNDLLS